MKQLASKAHRSAYEQDGLCLGHRATVGVLEWTLHLPKLVRSDTLLSLLAFRISGLTIWEKTNTEQRFPM